MLDSNSEDLIPALEPEGLECLRDYMRGSKTFLEYGMGGSTVLAATSPEVKRIVSVDTHPVWVETVTRALSERKVLSKATLLYCDVGEVGHLGKPLNTLKVVNWFGYSTMPWKLCYDDAPDCVFIDGRFRIAAFVTSIFLGRESTYVLFDDYVGRQEYHVVEKFIIPERLVGRLAVFKVPKNFNKALALDILLTHSLAIR